MLDVLDRSSDVVVVVGGVGVGVVVGGGGVATADVVAITAVVDAAVDIPYIVEIGHIYVLDL